MEYLPMIKALPLWTPAKLTTYAWYDAAAANTITQVGGAVSQWNDKSANALNLAQAGANKPVTGTRNINGVNALDFDGASQLILRANGMPDGDVTAFGLINADASTGGFWLANSGSGAARSRQYLGQSGVDFGNTTLAFVAPANGTPYIAMGQVNDFGSSALQGYRVDGGALTTGGLLRAVPNVTMAAGGNSGGINLFNGLIGEIIVFTSLLSDPNRQLVEGYLAWKWGTAGSLPADHPFKLTPPRAA